MSSTRLKRSFHWVKSQIKELLQASYKEMPTHLYFFQPRFWGLEEIHRAGPQLCLQTLFSKLWLLLWLYKPYFIIQDLNFWTNFCIYQKEQMLRNLKRFQEQWQTSEEGTSIRFGSAVYNRRPRIIQIKWIGGWFLSRVEGDWKEAVLGWPIVSWSPRLLLFFLANLQARYFYPQGYGMVQGGC